MDSRKSVVALDAISVADVSASVNSLGTLTFIPQAPPPLAEPPVLEHPLKIHFI